MCSTQKADLDRLFIRGCEIQTVSGFYQNIVLQCDMQELYPDCFNKMVEVLLNGSPVQDRDCVDENEKLFEKGLDCYQIVYLWLWGIETRA